MPNSVTKCITNILDMASTFDSIQFLNNWLDTNSILAFSFTCKAAKRITDKSLTKQLLNAVARGDEDDAKIIVKSYGTITKFICNYYRSCR